MRINTKLTQQTEPKASNLVWMFFLPDNSFNITVDNHIELRTLSTTVTRYIVHDQFSDKSKAMTPKTSMKPKG